MRANREYSIGVTLKYEGGYVNNPKDPGGETNFGITKAVARENGYTGDMHHIPMSLVLNIYTKRYWLTAPYNCDTLAGGVDLCTFDFGVNSGPSRAGKYLKQAVGGTPTDTVKRLSALRLGFLHGLHTWKTFGPGWGTRVAGVEAKSTKLALEAEGKLPVVVKKELDKAADEATIKKTTEVAKGGGSGTVVGGSGEVARETAPPSTPAPTPSPDQGVLPDHTWFDWHTLLTIGEWVLIVGGVVLLAFFLYRAYIQHIRAQEFKAVAAEVTT